MDENATTTTTQETTLPETTPPEANPELDAAKSAAESAVQKQKAAENALDALRKEFSQLKKAHMTAEEQKEAEYAAVKTERQELAKRMNSLSAEKILVGANLAAEDYQDALGLIVSEDSEKTEAIAKWVVDVLGKARKETEKTVREKLIRETPHPPAGASSEPEDEVQQELNRRLEKYNKVR